MTDSSYGFCKIIAKIMIILFMLLLLCCNDERRAKQIPKNLKDMAEKSKDKELNVEAESIVVPKPKDTSVKHKDFRQSTNLSEKEEIKQKWKDVAIGLRNRLKNDKLLIGTLDHIPLYCQIGEDISLDLDSNNSESDILFELENLCRVCGGLVSRDRRLEGKIVLKFTLKPDGSIVNDSILSSTTGDKEFDEKVRNKVKSWSGWGLEEIGNGTTTIMVPFIFRSNYGAAPSERPQGEIK